MDNYTKNNLAKCNEGYLEKLQKNNRPAYEYLMRGIEIIGRLNEKMYEAYIVGGAVRDIILNTPFKDIDISTSATPSEVMALFPHGDNHYQDMGCITLREGSNVFEITSFRTEEYDGKSRRPTKIHYSKKLIDDIMRRDFTINALALSANMNIIDITKKGIPDLKHKIVRVIGKGKNRFIEDPIRIFRGLELVAKYNFSMDYPTILDMRATSKVFETLTFPRITEETLKIFRHKNRKKAFYYMAQYEIFKSVPEYNKWIHSMIGTFSKLSLLDIFATLFYQLGKIPANVPFSREEITEIQKITKTIHLLEIKKLDRMLVYQNNYESLLSANKILLMLDKNYKNQAYNIKRLYKSAYIKDRSELNFKTEDLIKIMQGETGPRVGLIMNLLTKLVVMGEVNNNYSMLKQEVLKMLTMSDAEINTRSEQLDTPDQTPVNETINDDPDTLLRLAYKKEFKSIYDTLLKQIKTYDSMTIEEQRVIEKEIVEKTRKTLLDTNPEYRALFEKKPEKKGTKKEDEEV